MTTLSACGGDSTGDPSGTDTTTPDIETPDGTADTGNPTPDPDATTDTTDPDSALIDDSATIIPDTTEPDTDESDTTEPDATPPDTTDPPDGSDLTDTDQPNPEPALPSLPEAELLIKIIGVPGQEGGKRHVAVASAVTPIAGVAFGSPDSIAWTSTPMPLGNTLSGTANGYPFWQTGPISLDPGLNIITVTATKGQETVTDTIIITYNPLFMFNTPPVVSPDSLFVNESTKVVVTIPITEYSKLMQYGVCNSQKKKCVGTPLAQGNLSGDNTCASDADCDYGFCDPVLNECKGSKAPQKSCNTDIDCSTTQAWLVDKDGNILDTNPLGTMVDNGQLSNCDEIEQDGRFSVCLNNFKCTSAEDKWVVVSTQVDSSFANYTAYSAPTRIECSKRITVSECNAAYQTQQNAYSKWEDEGGANDPMAARDATIAWLKTQTTVADAGPSSGDGHGVWVEFNAGFVGALDLAPEGTRGGAGPALAEMAARVAPQELSPFNVESIQSKRSLILAPYNQEFKAAGGDEADDIASLLSDSSCPSFDVQGPVTGSSANLEVLRNQYLYGVVAMTSHGDAYFETMNDTTKNEMDWEHSGSQEVIWSGEAVKCNQFSTTQKTCKASLQQGQQVTITACPTGTECVFTSATSSSLTGVCVDRTQTDLANGRVVMGRETWGTTGSFVSRYAPVRFPNSFIYLGTCRSVYNGTIAAEYFAAGAKSIAGYSGYTKNAYAYASGKSVFEEMVLNGDLTGSAAFEVPEQDPDTADNRLRLFGADNLDIMNADIINPSFETGDLTGWTKNGDGRVISKLGISQPVHGKFMGVISTGLGFTVQTGEISQNFCIPADKQAIKFYWKFFSEEFKEWCGSSYQDTFQATVTGSQGKLTLVNVKIDDLCFYDDGSCQNCPNPGKGNCECGSQYLGLKASDVSFDQGGVFNIKWQSNHNNKDTGSWDITPFAGAGPVQLKFFSSDAGDSIYDTVILVDSVIFK